MKRNVKNIYVKWQKYMNDSYLDYRMFQGKSITIVNDKSTETLNMRWEWFYHLTRSGNVTSTICRGLLIWGC